MLAAALPDRLWLLARRQAQSAEPCALRSIGGTLSHMADKITFTNVQLLSFGRKPEGGSAKFSAASSDKVSEAMGWQDIPECLTGGKLEGELRATSATLSPNEKELRKHETELDISRVSGFETVRLELERSKGKGHRTELRFSISFSDPNGARKLEQYITSCGKSRLIVSYTKQAEQEEMLLATEEQRQATLPEAD